MFAPHLCYIWQSKSVTTKNGLEVQFLPLKVKLTEAAKITKTLVAGDTQITDSTSNLKAAVVSYNMALNNVHLHVTIKVLELLKGLLQRSWVASNCT